MDDATDAHSGAEPTEQDVAPAWVSVMVAIPTRNRGALIEETLAAFASVRYPALEIVVVDQSTDGRTAPVVRAAMAKDPRVRYHASRQEGSSLARNLALAVSEAEIIAYTDDDCIVTEDWVRAAAEALRDSQVAGVFGRLLPYEYEGRTGIDVGLKDLPHRQVYTNRVPPWYIGHGGNMAFRRADLLAVGGFDPLLGAGNALASNEDGDIAYRLLRAEKHLVYSPEMLAYHKHWKDWPAQARMERAYGIGAGAQFAKYLRCGDRYGLALWSAWMWQLGLRRLGAGLLKWRSRKTMYLGYCQLVYPWVGMWRARRYAVDREHLLYADPSSVLGEGAPTQTLPTRSQTPGYSTTSPSASTMRSAL